MKTIILLAIISVIFAAEPVYKPLSCAVKKGASILILTFEDSQAGKALEYKKGETWTKIGTPCSFDSESNKILTCTNIDIDAGTYDIRLQATGGNTDLAQKLKVVAGQSIWKINNATLDTNKDEKRDIHMLLGLETDDKDKVGYKSGDKVTKFTGCTTSKDAGKEEIVSCTIKIADKGDYKLTYGDTETDITIKVAGSYLTMSLAFIVSLLLF